MYDSPIKVLEIDDLAFLLFGLMHKKVFKY